MPQLKFSNTANQDLLRLYDFLARYDTNIAADAIDTILHEIKKLKTNPFYGTPVQDRPNVRKLVIDFGASGYLSFTKYHKLKDIVVVSIILHQKEYYDLETIGLDSENDIN